MNTGLYCHWDPPVIGSGVAKWVLRFYELYERNQRLYLGTCSHWRHPELFDVTAFVSSLGKMAGILQTTSENVISWIVNYNELMKRSVRFLSKGSINNVSVMVHVMAWWRINAKKSLPEPLMTTIHLDAIWRHYRVGRFKIYFHPIEIELPLFLCTFFTQATYLMQEFHSRMPAPYFKIYNSLPGIISDSRDDFMPIRHQAIYALDYIDILLYILPWYFT